MQLYELLFILIPSITDAEVDKTIKQLLDSLKKEAEELTVKEQKQLGRRKFTYPINHLAEGTYVLIDFETETKSVHAINRALELEDNVLRHMIVKKQIKSAEQIEKEEKLKIEMQQNKASESRERRTTPQEKLVQKAEELPTKKEGESVAPEELDKKLDEILKKEIT